MRVRIAVAAVILVAALAAVSHAADMPKGWLGAALEPAPSAITEDGVAAPAGAVVTMIVEDSPAQHAGLRGGDVVIGIDGLDVTSPAEMIDRIKKLPPDSWIGLRVMRRGAERQLDVRLGSRPEDTTKSRYVRGWIGLRAMEIPPKVRSHFGAPENAGVMVTDLVAAGPAEAGGVSIGDVIYEVDGKPVTSVGALHEMIARCGVGNEVDLSVGRDGNPLVLVPVIDRQPKREPE